MKLEGNICNKSKNKIIGQYWGVGKFIKVNKQRDKPRPSRDRQYSGDTIVNFMRASTSSKSHFENELIIGYHLKAMRYPNRLVELLELILIKIIKNSSKEQETKLKRGDA